MNVTSEQKTIVDMKAHYPKFNVPHAIQLLVDDIDSLKRLKDPATSDLSGYVVKHHPNLAQAVKHSHEGEKFTNLDLVTAMEQRGFMVWYDRIKSLVCCQINGDTLCF